MNIVCSGQTVLQNPPKANNIHVIWLWYDGVLSNVDPYVDVPSSNHHWIIEWKYVHLSDTCVMNKSKVAAISLSTKTAEKPCISDIWMCDMVEECMMPHQEVRFMWLWLCLKWKGKKLSQCRQMWDHLYAKVPKRRWFRNSALGTFIFYSWKGDAERSTTKSSCKFYLKKKTKHTSIRITRVVRAQLANFNSKEVNAFHQCPFQPNIKPA